MGCSNYSVGLGWLVSVRVQGLGLRFMAGDAGASREDSNSGS